MSAIGIPFVWLYVKTEETNFTKARPVSITGESLRSFTEEVMMDAPAVDGSPSANYAVTKCRLIIFDPTWTYWETLLLINKNLDYEYGWMGDDGKVISTSGKIRATLQELYPKFSFQGTDVEVTLTGSPSANAPQGSNFNYATWKTSRLFIPESEFEGLRNGTFYNSKTPSVRFLLPAERKSYEESLKKWKILNDARNRGTRFFGQLADPGLPPIPPPQNAAVDEEDARAKFGERESLPLNAAPYKSVSELVTRLAGLLGMKADVDETIPARTGVRIEWTNCTIEEFIRTRLVPLATLPSGQKNFRCWIRGDTLYFKSMSSASTSKILARSYVYGGNNKSLGDTTPFGSTSEGTLLEFEVQIQPNFLINSAASSAAMVSINPVEKTNIGSHIVSGGASVGEFNLPKSDISDELVKEFASFSNVLRTGTEFRLTPAVMPVESMSADFMLWDEAQKIAENVVNQLSNPVQSAEQLPNANNEVIAVRDGKTKRSLSDAASPAERRFLQSVVVPAAYAKLQAERRKQQAVVASQGGDLSWADVADLQAKRPPSQAADPTLVGRLYVLPYPDAKVQDIAAHTNSASFVGRVFKATGVTYGDPSLRLFQRVDIKIVTNGGLHYSSGVYIITGVNHKIDSAGFTSELTLNTTGFNPSSATTPARITAEQNPSFSKPPADQSKQGFEIKAESQ